MRQVNGQGQQGGGIVTGITKHHALVAGADRFNVLFPLLPVLPSADLLTPIAMSQDWLAKATKTPHVLQSKPLSVLS